MNDVLIEIAAAMDCTVKAIRALKKKYEKTDFDMWSNADYRMRRRLMRARAQLGWAKLEAEQDLGDS